MTQCDIFRPKNRGSVVAKIQKLPQFVKDELLMLNLAFDITHILLDGGAKVDIYNNKLLIEACTTGNVDLVRLCITYGADINANYGTPLWQASANGHKDVVQLLLENGVCKLRINQAFRSACFQGHLEIVDILLQHGANVHDLYDEALIDACHVGHHEIVKLLLRHGANANAQNNFPFRSAYNNMDFKMIKILLKGGAILPADHGITSPIVLLYFRLHQINFYLQQAILKLF